MRGQSAPDLEIARLAASQGGVVARSQLLALGLSGDAVDGRLRSGRLHRVHRGVYAVGHPLLGERGAWMAAVLALAPHAVLSHASAAAAWDLRRSHSTTVHVTIADRSGRKRRRGVRVHRCASLRREDVTTHGGIAITTPARTLLDLAADGVRGRALEALLDRADLLRILELAEVEGLLARSAGRPGAAALAATLSRFTPGSVITRSELEDRFLALCHAHDIPRPRVNCTVAGRERDFAWPGARLVAEVDGYAWHRSPSAFGDDRERDVWLVVAGYRVLRFTWEHVTARPAYVAGTLRRALGAP